MMVMESEVCLPQLQGCWRGCLRYCKVGAGLRPLKNRHPSSGPTPSKQRERGGLALDSTLEVDSPKATTRRRLRSGHKRTVASGCFAELRSRKRHRHRPAFLVEKRRGDGLAPASRARRTIRMRGVRELRAWRVR